jgi:hypothetical protein
MNSSGAYAVFYTDGGDLTLLVKETGILTGTAFDRGTNHYFSTDKGGVYHSASGQSDFSNITGNLAVTGMIRIPAGEIIALCANGDLYTVSGSSATNRGNAGVNLPGPAAVWANEAGYLLLAASRSSTSSTNSTYGYRELKLDSGGSLPGTVTMKEPGNENPSTGDDNKRYRDTIEPKPVNAIFQAPDDIDPDRALFASVQGRGTAKDNTDGGLWSYRSRGGVWQWNAEE